jgi:hypothetical protein
MPCIHTYGPKHEQRACRPGKENPFLCEHRGLSGPDHHVKCAIQWIDSVGNPTPDYNDAIGVCYTEAYIEITRMGNAIHHERSIDYPICAEHAKQFETYPTREKLINAHWKFVPLAQYSPPER